MTDELDEIFGKSDAQPAATPAAKDVADLDDELDGMERIEKQVAREAALAADSQAQENARRRSEAESASRSLGMSDEEIAEIGDLSALEKANAVLRRKAAEATAREGDGSPAPAGQAPGDAAGESLPGVDLDAIIAANPDDAIDPETAKANKVLATALKALLQQKRPAAPQAPKADDGALDALVSAQGRDYADVFGDPELPARELAERSPQRMARRLVVEETERIREKARAEKRAVPGIKEAFQQALGNLYPEKVRQVQERRAQAKVDERRGQFLARPGGSAPADAMTPKQRAVKNVAEKLAGIRS